MLLVVLLRLRLVGVRVHLGRHLLLRRLLLLRVVLLLLLLLELLLLVCWSWVGGVLIPRRAGVRAVH